MKRLILLAMVLSACTAVAQDARSAGGVSPDEPLIQANQRKVEERAGLLSMDLTHGAWTHQKIRICPVFPQHIFVYYENSVPKGKGPAFLAILPRQNGPVRLIQLRGGPAHARPIAEQAYAMEAFNATWREELNASSPHIRLETVNWPEMAHCYASLTGERLAEVPHDAGEEQPAPMGSYMGIGVLQPLMKQNGHERSISVNFDRNGMVQNVTVADAVGPPSEP